MPLQRLTACRAQQLNGCQRLSFISLGMHAAWLQHHQALPRTGCTSSFTQPSAAGDLRPVQDMADELMQQFMRERNAAAAARAAEAVTPPPAAQADAPAASPSAQAFAAAMDW
jgi:hypothetical protein